MAVLIGTSGWQYDSWRHEFHAGVPQRRWFEHTMAAFRTVELNVTFYRLPNAETFTGWCRRSPDDAVITVKASRYLTHVKRLREPEEPVQRLMSRASELGPKLGPVLLQLPPDMRVNTAALAATLTAFDPRVRIAVETRHESWWCDEVRELLTAHRAAHVWSDRGGHPLGPLWRTSDWGYVRLHHGDAFPPPNYHRATLGTWAERIGAAFDDEPDVFVYFNNDPRCAAVDNAITFGEEVARVGLTPTRTPAIRPNSWT
jgi:uncharacterized protein YecE (DUF72 family)